MNGDAVLLLLLDLDPASGLGAKLEGILESELDERIQLRRERIDSFEAELRDAEVRDVLFRTNPNLVFLVLPEFAGEKSLDLIGSIFQSISAPVIVAMERGRPEEMLKLLQFGATDFVTPPMTPLNILPRMWRLVAQARRRGDMKDTLRQRLGLKNLVGESSIFLAEVNRIPLVAKTDVTVLILGETGTGKELFARAIHYLGPRAAKPFVPVNCGAIPPELVENELFGHERGAFTNASTCQAGLVSEADGGTLFLDEIDCLPLMAQVKLLRFTQEKEYRQLGSPRTNRADLRIIAASNADLRARVRDGSMRRDLYYRLNIIPFLLPPLRDRRDDIPLLARRFLAKYAADLDRQFAGISPEAMRALLAYDWPGNVRELEHVIERAAVLSQGPIIVEQDIILGSESGNGQSSFRAAKARIIDQFEKSYLSGLLLAHDGNITKAAQAAGKNRRAFFELMRKHNLKGKSFKAHA